MNKILQNRLDIEEGEIWTEYTGTREELIAGEVATRDMFPGDGKRVKSHIGDTIAGNWIVSRLREERFTVTLMHERKPGGKQALPWDPVSYKDTLLRHTAGAFDYLVLQAASGDVELGKYGSVTHRLSDKDQQKLSALREYALHVIRQARVERGKRHLSIVPGRE